MDAFPISKGKPPPPAPGLEEQWATFQSRVASGQLPTITLADVPFPRLPLALHPALQRDPQQRREAVRALQMRWHPDKFLQAYGDRLHPPDADRILTRVKEVSQAINAL
eukprot:TRINITY_DN14328_c0_g1_i1.p3 TRINITY_DN14328_c0_g1~~TRINITY_DN14328_c0_g1_i1.p3  ORF type:complete len:118 (-),score=34.75 TRINITY_DN14328_c0_g1_i1:353-679(-)